ncbi:GNAT family N-acetyltransferase [Acinetobacter sp. S40]|uniref:GNAT family N-acetyltransferase n=1 Tax=Acinetobacter sp. S40 TaxID=2767434 RepID=UPI00190A6B7A|nr:GNAT family N-acetyltransferase [Acinetobacter sp. S40]MBJ9984859.1 GNAT family N-acetyltransferase [Acinetobacter sp. S40]
MLKIREAELKDAQILQVLLDQLGYVESVEFIMSKIKTFAEDPHQYIFVAQIGAEVAGFLSLSMIPQIAVAGDFARVAYLCVEKKFRGQKVGQALLAYAEEIARQRGCDRMELHSSDHRKLAHQFYLAQGYEDAPKYFRKFLDTSVKK